jgi:SOS response regulatory protein OraA/RecX
MSSDDLKKAVLDAAKTYGPERVRIELARERVGFSTIQKMMTGKYEPEMKERLSFAVKSVLSRLSSEKAS